MNLQQLPYADQPRNKLKQHGARSLTESELLALILGKGIRHKNAKDLALDVLVHHHNDLHRLFRSSPSDLEQFSGIGPAKASLLMACFELGRRMSCQIPERGTIIKNSQDVYQYVRKTFSMLTHEEFLVILMNNNNEIIHAHRLSRGGMTGTVADGRILFKIALDFKATAILLCHNHPSGNPKPSDQDIRLTKNYRKFGQYIDIPVLDHLIYTDYGYFSFADEGLLDTP